MDYGHDSGCPRSYHPRGAALAAPALEQPDCGPLQHWAAGFADHETVALAPKVEISTQLAVGRIEPLFGSPVAQWYGRDFSLVKRMLDNRRRAAGKRRDKPAADELSQAMRALAEAALQLKLMQQIRASSARSVDNRMNYHPVPELRTKPQSGLSVQDKMDLLSVCE